MRQTFKPFKVSNFIEDKEYLKQLDTQHIDWCKKNDMPICAHPSVGNATQVITPPAFYPLVNVMHEYLQKTLNYDLLLTFWFSTTYHHNSWLWPHVDIPQCNINVTLNINQDIETPWPIHIWDWSDNSMKQFETDIGDMVVYNGDECLHYRNQYHGQRYHQVFFHFVIRDSHQHKHSDTEKRMNFTRSNINKIINGDLNDIVQV